MSDANWVPDKPEYFHTDVLENHPTPWKIEWYKPLNTRTGHFRVVDSNEVLIFNGYDSYSAFEYSHWRQIVSALNALPKNPPKKQCDLCGGPGYLMEYRDMINPTKVLCHRCAGSGKV